MDDAALQAMNRELKRADTMALELKEKGEIQKRQGRRDSKGETSLQAASAFKSKVKVANHPRMSLDLGSDDGRGSRADSRVRGSRAKRASVFHQDEDSRSNGGSERRSLGRSSGKGSENRRDGSMGGDSSAPSKSLGLVEVLAETEGVCSMLWILLRWLPVVLFHGQTLLQLQSFFSLFYLLSIPLELAFSVGSIPCLTEGNWRPGSVTNSSRALCDPNNADGAEVGSSATHRTRRTSRT